MRDPLYEEQLLRNQQQMCLLLDTITESTWTQLEQLAAQRALQILIESAIGMARYVVRNKFQIKRHKSREAIDELKLRGCLDSETHRRLLKMIGFRNVIVHDYLNLDDEILRQVILKRDYALVPEVTQQMAALLDQP